MYTIEDKEAFLHTLRFKDKVQRDLVLASLDSDEQLNAESWNHLSQLIHNNAAIEHMSEFFYKWLEIELEYRGFLLISMPPPKRSIQFVGRQYRHDPGKVLQLSGVLEGPYDFTRQLFNVDPTPYRKLNDFAQNCGRGYAVECSVLWVMAAKKPE